MSQYDDYKRDFSALRTGSKPAIIVERRKSAKAYLEIATACAEADIPVAFRDLADSSGMRYPALIAGSPVAIKAIQELLDNRDAYTREAFQMAMGRLLGYELQDCLEYVRSPLSRRCGCECCGGPTRSSKLDDDARKARLTDFWGDRS